MPYGPFLKDEFSVLHGKNASDLTTGHDFARLDSLIKLAGELFSLENVGFLCAVQQYRCKAHGASYLMPPQLFQKKLLIPESEWGGANTMGNWIYQTYIPQGAPFQVNLKAPVRLELEKIAKQRSAPFLPRHFTPAFDAIAELIQNDWLNRVKKPKSLQQA